MSAPNRASATSDRPESLLRLLFLVWEFGNLKFWFRIGVQTTGTGIGGKLIIISIERPISHDLEKLQLMNVNDLVFIAACHTLESTLDKEFHEEI